jgi:hypothetical protein
MKNSTFAMVLKPAAAPVKPKKPATREISKKMMAHLIMAVCLSRRQELACGYSILCERKGCK